MNSSPKLRAVALLLLCVVVLTVFSCTRPQNSSGDTTDQGIDTGTDELDPKLPAKDFGGEDVIILCREYSTYPEFGVFEESVNRVDNAVYKRNRYLSEKYHVKLEVLYKDFQQIASFANEMVQVSEHCFDIITSGFMYQFFLAVNGRIYEKSGIPVIDLSREYWNQSILSDTSINGKNHYFVSDANIWSMNAAGVVFFNVDMLDDLNISENPYELVRNNGWTYDKMTEMSRAVYTDLDGDKTVSLADRFGSVSTVAACETMFVGLGGSIIGKDGDDIPNVAVTEQKNIDIIEKLVNFWSDDSSLLINRYESYSSPREGGNLLADTLLDNRALFSQEQLYQLSTFADSEYVIGMVPCPKYNESQKNYDTFVHMAHGSATSVPLFLGGTDLEIVGYILEDMAWYSNKTIRPEYYDVNLKSRRAQDSESAEMLDVIFSHIRVDIGTLMESSGINARNIIRNLVQSKNNNVTSYINAAASSYDPILESVMGSFN